MDTRIKFSFTSFTDANFEKQSLGIGQSMTGNSYFPNPVPSLSRIKDATSEYTIALVNAEDRSRLHVAIKRSARLLLEGLLRQLGMYVMQESNGNTVMQVSSGFPLGKVREPRVLATPGNVTLSNGRSSGQLRATVSAVAGVRSYLHSITTDVPGNKAVWTSIASSRATITFDNLQPGTCYYVRTTAIGSDGQTTISPVSSLYAQ